MLAIIEPSNLQKSAEHIEERPGPRETMRACLISWRQTGAAGTGLRSGTAVTAVSLTALFPT